MSGDSGREPVCPRRETTILACQRRKLSAAFPKSGTAVLVRKQLANPRQVSTVVPGSAPACCARKTRQAQRRVCMTASIEESNFQHFSAPDASPHANIEAASAVPRGHTYYSVQNQFERFRGFLELIRRFEFELRRRENYIF